MSLEKAILARATYRRRCHLRGKHYPQTNWNKVLGGPRYLPGWQLCGSRKSVHENWGAWLKCAFLKCSISVVSQCEKMAFQWHKQVVTDILSPWHWEAGLSSWQVYIAASIWKSTSKRKQKSAPTESMFNAASGGTFWIHPGPQWWQTCAQWWCEVLDGLFKCHICHRCDAVHCRLTRTWFIDAQNTELCRGPRKSKTNKTCPLTRERKEIITHHVLLSSRNDRRRTNVPQRSARSPSPFPVENTELALPRPRCCSLERQPAAGSLTRRVSARPVCGTKMLFEVNEASAYFFTSTVRSLCTANVKAAPSTSKNQKGGGAAPTPRFTSTRVITTDTNAARHSQRRLLAQRDFLHTYP